MTTIVGRVRRANPPAVLLGIGALVWTVTFAFLVVRRHHHFWSVDFDMGIHDQSVWLLAHGRTFMTVRGLSVFGHHATLGYFFLVPAYWTGMGPDFLNVLQVVVLALGTVPLYLLARDRGLSTWVAAALGAAFLLHPAVQFFSWELFHPEVVAVTPLLCAYLCASRRSWGWYAVWILVAVSWKEDVALAVVVMGLIVALRWDRRAGIATVAGAGAWFLLWTLALFPAINGGAVQSAGIYAGVGGSPGAVVGTVFRDPGAVTSRVFSSESGEFAWRLLLPFGFVPLAAPLVVLIGAPQFLLDVLTDVPWTRVIEHHYAALCIGALALATVEAVAWLSRRLGTVAASVATLVVLAGGLFGTLDWGPSPVSARYGAGWWPPASDSRLDAKRAAVAAVPDGASVSASYTLVPQLSRRAEIYSFPNPWRSVNFGIDGSPRRDPGRIDYLVVDLAPLNPTDSLLLGRILRSPRWKVLSDRDGIVVARRVPVS